MIYLLSFADGGIFEDTQKKFDDTLQILGADKHITYGKKDITNTNFYRQNEKIFRIEKGFGLYIWKPYIISDQLSKINENDYLFYCDCSRHINEGFTHSILSVISYMEKNNICLMPGNRQTITNELYTSNRCIDRIRKDYEFDVAAFKTSWQHTAGHIIIKKTPDATRFIDDWLRYCQIWECIYDKKKKAQQGFHNYDMAIFNVLLFIYDIKNPNEPLHKYVARNHNTFLSQFVESS